MLIDHKVWFIKEKVDFLKLAGEYEIYMPETNQQIGVAKEEPGGMIKLLRLLINKILLPNKVNVYDTYDQKVLFTMQKPFSLFSSKVSVTSGSGENLGYFQSKVFTIGGGFRVFDPSDRQVAEIKGDWKGWNFKFLNESGAEIGTITKKWAGIGKELFTSADNYIIALNETQTFEPKQVILLLAAGLAVDIVFKENKK
ncbi:MAG TPA: phospholipid scramblase-related protein [Bacillota bacterium]|nr:phospholipid scramblase-related protein [Bacillota bacterium]